MLKRSIIVTIFLIVCIQSSLSWKQRYARDLDSLQKSSEEYNMDKDKDNLNIAKKENVSPAEQLFLTPADKTKRQTTIVGNHNRINNLINLPVNLNVIANVLSEINEGVVAATPKQSLSGNTIIGNDNTVSNLVNLPLDVNAGINVLSTVDNSKATATDDKKPSGRLLGGLLGGAGVGGVLDGLLGGGIVGGLLNNTLGSGGESGSGLVGGLLETSSSKPGLVGGLVSNTLGGASSSGLVAGLVDGVTSNSGLVGGLLSGIAGGESNSGLVGGLVGNTLEGVVGKDGLLGDLLSNALGDTLGNTLGDLLGALLGNDALVGQVVGTVGGKGLVNGLLETVLSAVVKLIDNLLHLLEGLLDGLASGITQSNVTVIEVPKSADAASGADLHIEGNNNVVSSLINAPIRINALINILSTLRQELTGQVVKSESSSHTGTVIKGNNNKIASLVNLPLNADLNLNLLSDVTHTLGNKQKKTNEAKHPENANFDTKPGGSAQSTSPGSVNIQGDDNILSNLLNVAPNVNLQLNLLSQLTELLGGAKAATSLDSDPNVICFDIPISEAKTSIVGNNNKISNGVNLSPEINLDLNLLSSITHTGGTLPPHVATQRVCVKKPTTTEGITIPEPPKVVEPLAVTTEKSLPPVPVNPPTEICFDVIQPIPNADTVINGNNNQISSLINVAPQLNLGLNILSNIKKPAPANTLGIKRICIPLETTTKPPVPGTSTNPNCIPHNSNTPQSDKRCFRRTCTQWKYSVDHSCQSQPVEYPVFTSTQNL